MAIAFGSRDVKEMMKLAALIRDLNKLGHNPATSGNYSLLSQDDPKIAIVSESGVDKSIFSGENFLPMDVETKKVSAKGTLRVGQKPSDESAIHLTIYQLKKAKCVLHSHMLESVLFADMFFGKDNASICGLEIMKAFRGVKTHETQIDIPCFENTQDINNLSEQIKERLSKQEESYGLLIRGHGIYVWGDSIDEAKRHLEAFEYIFKYYLRTKRDI